MAEWIRIADIAAKRRKNYTIEAEMGDKDGEDKERE